MNFATSSTILALSTVTSTLYAGYTTQIIDFGPSFRDPADGIILLDETFDDTFERLGVHFSSPTGNPIFWLGDDYGFSAAANSISMGDPRTGENSTHPLRADFLVPVNTVSIHGIDGGGDIDTLRIRAYTNDGVQVAVDVLSSNFRTGGTVTAIADRIDYIIVEQSGAYHGLFLDDLIYTQIPAPSSSFALLGLGVLVQRRRRE